MLFSYLNINIFSSDFAIIESFLSFPTSKTYSKLQNANKLLNDDKKQIQQLSKTYNFFGKNLKLGCENFTNFLNLFEV
jgi:hypothetical protein